MPRPLPDPILKDIPCTALAPMQDVTTWEFMKVVDQFGSPDYYFTEYFRVHETSILEKHILYSITDNPTSRPVFAQLIGENLDYIARTVEDLSKHPVAGIDLNLGCPAPKVYKKKVGGGLLRDLDHVDKIFGLLREISPHRFTVKSRIGFDDTLPFEGLIDLINKHNVDLLSLHGRTVKEMYWADVHYDYIAHAVDKANCPVLANGNITSYLKAAEVLKDTGCFGLMVGRSAIRNPWIFRQIREHFTGQEVYQPTLGDVYEYAHLLIETLRKPKVPEQNYVNKLKKFFNFIGLSVDPDGHFLHEIRRVRNFEAMNDVLKRHLLDHADTSFSNEPYPGLVARPNRETQVRPLNETFSVRSN
ncbi:MAG: tRNA-dihydrouridine synthase family protein [Verrucomicrobia bacterium]|nr:tRNA-dihydrouridine synthase family protein [Verrucomicrobiota bacterium]MDA1067020.1 tRNA-dihydrouridine synthase family protein [Verrucomicrobiota bacterium]